MKHHFTAVALLLVLSTPIFVTAQEYFDPENYYDPKVVPSTNNTSNGSGVNNAPSNGAGVNNTSSNGSTVNNAPLNGSVGTNANAVSTQGRSASVTLENPLRGVNSLGDFIYIVINFVYSLSYAFIAFFLLWSGFKFVMAQGKPKELDDAKATFKYTIIGAILLIGASVITEVVRTVINKFVVTSI